MLFTSLDSIPQSMAAAVVRAVQAVDAFADVRIDAAGHRIEIEGRVTDSEARKALQSAGCSVELTDESPKPGHVSGGSTCCGSCS